MLHTEKTIDDVLGYVDRFAPPIPVDSVVSYLGINLKYEDLNSNMAGSIEKLPDPDGYVITVNINDTDHQRRFTIAHEISHFLLHKDVLDNSSKMHRIIDDKNYRSDLSTAREIEANNLAAQLLMPAEMITASIKEYNERKERITTKTLAKIFNVSFIAMRIRLGSPT